ncbi:MAG: PilZ domain-containing protein [Desulfobacterales bacterium]|jgi:Tfp pilus assembly protein PilZ
MDSSSIITSIGLGAGLFVGLIIFWFFHAVIKRRLGKDQVTAAINTAQVKGGKDQRRHPRIAATWSATMEIDRMSVNVRLKNISLGGAFVVCQDPVPLNGKLRIHIEVPNQDRLALNAEVVWSNMNMPEAKVIHRGLGVKFVQNTDAARKRLEEAIAHQESSADVTQAKTADQTAGG